MNLKDLDKRQLVALAIQFKVFRSVTKAATKSINELVTALEATPAVQELVSGCDNPVNNVRC